MKGNRFLIAASLFQFALFIPVALWARKHPQPPLEVAVTNALQRKRSGLLHGAMWVFSTITGSATLLNVLDAPLAAVVLWKRGLRLEALMTVGISWSSATVRTVIKWLVDRPRPHLLLVHISHHKHTKSFPSGHVTSAVDFWGWLLALALQPGSRWWQKALISLAALCLAMVGPSRVYLGDHWATDVLGGYLFGAGWLCLSLQFYLLLREKKRFYRPRPRFSPTQPM
jgi:undecaprenyl-diphosphatase